jgi:hypothetical protein
MSAAAETSDSESAVCEAADRFHAAIRNRSYEELIPTVAAADARGIRERLNANLPLMPVENLERFFVEAVARNAQPGQSAEPDFHVTLPDADHARLDIEPLLSFRHSVYLVREEGAWKVDLATTLRRTREPRPKEEIISICRQALRGIADDADLVETRHFLIFAHTGPLPAQATSQLLEELYDNFQQVYPFDLGATPSAPPAPSEEPSAPVSLASAGPREMLPFSPGPDPYMVVFLFSYHQTFLEFAKRHDPMAMRTGGYATPTGYFAVWFSPALPPTVRHEGTHLLMFRRMHLFGAPSWVAEGMAEDMADPRNIADAQRPLRERLLGGAKFELGPLMLRQPINFGLDYPISQSLVHYLRTEHAKEWTELVAFIRKSPRPRTEECRAELLRLLDMTQSQLDETWRQFVLDAKPER